MRDRDRAKQKYGIGMFRATSCCAVAFLFVLMSCGPGALVQPDLISARAQVSTDLSSKTEDIKIGLPEDPTKIPAIESVLVSGSSIYLGFSQTLDGSFDKNSSVKIWACTPSPAACTPFTGFTIKYAPQGGYIPPFDTSVSKFPPPAIVVNLLQALPAGQQIKIYVIAQKISNTHKNFMAQLKDMTTPDNTPAAAAVWFQTP